MVNFAKIKVKCPFFKLLILFVGVAAAFLLVAAVVFRVVQIVQYGCSDNELRLQPDAFAIMQEPIVWIAQNLKQIFLK